MAAADKAAVSLGVAETQLMENAGRAVAREILARNLGRDFTVLCGPGNNGGDGFVIARHLAQAGCVVKVAALDPSTQWSGAAAEMAAQLSMPIVNIDPARIGTTGLWIDALFGAGLTRPLEGLAAECAKKLFANREKVVAVDLPSGLPGDGAITQGPTAAAGLTVTFETHKPAHVSYPGRALCGDVVVAPIGMPAQALEQAGPSLWVNDPQLWRRVWPDKQAIAHKYSHGQVFVLSGGPLSGGAARLAATAALRIGAGLVHLFGTRDALMVQANHVTSIMLKPVDDLAMFDQLLADPRPGALLLGPGAGVGPELKSMVLAALARAWPLVLDADALTVFANDPAELFNAIKGPVVLTPHEGEFARLFPDLAYQRSHLPKWARALAAAERAGCHLILKGADSVIAGPQGQAAINVNAPPWLATAGSGDVLAGLVAGLLAQGMPPLAAAQAGVYAHGWLGGALGPGLIADDLAARTGDFLRGPVAPPLAIG
jgi:NAD(P)H-hydrate epimerase